MAPASCTASLAIYSSSIAITGLCLIRIKIRSFIISAIFFFTLSAQSNNSAPWDSIFFSTNLSICSGLDFAPVIWPPQLPKYQVESLELVLNIAGSYEGVRGWANLTNSFDDQGLSLGLLNQNLGQGS